ncbi:MAG: hypothetical protein JXB88_03355 [Spirochaetales bacterium]|nr:hypothetical protein [Spirochaetales bacterium]
MNRIHERATMPETNQLSKQKKNIFLTGAPSSGKTTVIKKIIPHLPSPAKGFYTEEERAGERRAGFMMHNPGRQKRVSCTLLNIR